jgi:hypothetical protein
VPNEEQDMIRPLTFRHPAFHGNNEHARESLLQLARLLDNNDPDATKASWIRSVWFHKEHHWGESPETAVIRRQFRTAAIGLLGKLRPLSELACRQYLNAEHLETVARHHGPSLKKLDVQTYLNALPTLVLLMGQFSALQDLYLLVHAAKDVALEGKPDLPNLRFLELRPHAASSSILTWFAQSSLPRLRTLILVTNTKEMNDVTALSTFMQQHGARLTKVRLDTDISHITAAVFPHTPNLCTLHIGLPNNVPDSQHIWLDLQNPPRQLTEVQYSGFGYNLGFYAPFFEQMGNAALKAQTERSLLQSFRVMRRLIPSSEAELFSWRKAMKQADRRRLGVWKMVTENTLKLLSLGIEVLDEYDVALSDVLEGMQVVRSTGYVGKEDLEAMLRSITMERLVSLQR